MRPVQRDTAKASEPFECRIRYLGRVEYQPTWRNMQTFTDGREPDTPDEIWFLEHPPVFTLGTNASMQHVIAPGDIPLIQIDRGGQVTYHGPGQVIAYLLYDLRRGGSGIKRLVQRLEQALIDLLAEYRIRGARRKGAPGVYVQERKIAALGLRVRGGCSYHGLSLNADMDLEPFARIDPCGYPGLEVTQMSDLHLAVPLDDIERGLAQQIAAQLGLGLQPSVDA